MSCQAVRDRLLRGERGGEITAHLGACPECARFALRWAAARRELSRRVEEAPPLGFARSVVARRPGGTEVLGRLALRALPAAAALALALAWWGLDQTPSPATVLLTNEPTLENLFTYSALAPEPSPLESPMESPLESN